MNTSSKKAASRRPIARCLIAIGVALAGGPEANGETYTAVPKVFPFDERPWDAPGTWSPEGVPGVGDIAIIHGAGSVVEVAGTITAGDVRLTRDETGNAGALGGSGRLNVMGDFLMEPYALVGNEGGISLHGTSVLGGSAPGDVLFYHNPTILDVDNHGAAGVFSQAGQNFGIQDGTNTVHWTNYAGSSLTLHDGARIGSSTQSQFVNEAGASFIKAGAGTSTVNWSFVNNGTIDVQEGTLVFTVPAPSGAPDALYYSGSGAINVSEGAKLAFVKATFADGTSLNGPVELQSVNTVTGSLNVTAGALAGTLTGEDYTVSGNLTLALGSTLDATGSVTLAGHVTAGSSTETGSAFIYRNGTVMTVNNTADVDVLAALGGDTYGLSEGTNQIVWNNLGGSTVTLHLGSALTYNHESLFHNQAGATLNKVDAETSEVWWSFRNDGLLNIEGGTLRFRGGTWSGAGEITLGEGAGLEFVDATFAANSSVGVAAALIGATTLGDGVSFGGPVVVDTSSLAGEGTVTFDQPIAMDYGVIIGEGAGLTINGSVIGSGYTLGPVTITGGFTPTAQAVIGSTLELDGGTATVYSDGAASVVADTNLGVGGAFISATGFVFVEGTSLHGAGTVQGDVEHLGVIAPGNSPGGIVFAGDLLLADTSQLVFEIGGLLPGTGYDTIAVDGLLTLDGLLVVTLIDGFSPNDGDVFEILDWEQVAGQFAALDLPELGEGLQWSTDALYTEGLLTVAPVPEPATWWLLAAAGLIMGLIGRRGLI